MMLRGHICSLRAVEPQDLELLCRWDNDPSSRSSRLVFTDADNCG